MTLCIKHGHKKNNNTYFMNILDSHFGFKFEKFVKDRTASFHTFKDFNSEWHSFGHHSRMRCESAITIFNFAVAIDGPKESSFILLQDGLSCHVYFKILSFGIESLLNVHFVAKELL